MERRFIHHLERAYTVWRAASLFWFQVEIISTDEMTELQLWVVQEKLDFGLFPEQLNTHFATKEKILDRINRVHSLFDKLHYINAFELACYFFLLARYCITSAHEYLYYNALIKANEFYGQFRGWYEIAMNEGKSLYETTITQSGAKLVDV